MVQVMVSRVHAHLNACVQRSMPRRGINLIGNVMRHLLDCGSQENLEKTFRFFR